MIKEFLVPSVAAFSGALVAFLLNWIKEIRRNKENEKLALSTSKYVLEVFLNFNEEVRHWYRRQHNNNPQMLLLWVDEQKLNNDKISDKFTQFIKAFKYGIYYVHGCALPNLKFETLGFLFANKGGQRLVRNIHLANAMHNKVMYLIEERNNLIKSLDFNRIVSKHSLDILVNSLEFQKLYPLTVELLKTVRHSKRYIKIAITDVNDYLENYFWLRNLLLSPF